MADWHLAQMNVGHMVDEGDSPALAGFMAQLDAINALADAAPGFVWRLQGEAGNATDIRPTKNTRFIVNMSVWTGIEPLFAYVYRTAHREVMVRRREWFERPDEAYQVLWWVKAGTAPTVEQGLARLNLLRADGPAQAAFTFRAVFPAPAALTARDMEPEPYCVGWR